MPRGRPRSLPCPPCPQHPVSSVSANGTAQRAAGRVRRFRCRLADGSTHVFTEPTSTIPAQRAADGTSVLVTAPVCPAHVGSKVVRNGSYGRGDERRQGYRCTPADGSPSHKFTPVLPRTRVLAEHTCDGCEEHVPVHRGPTAASRGYLFTTRDVAKVLIALGRGDSYVRAGQRIRMEHGLPSGSEPSWRLAADWCEVFAPVVTEPLLPRTWPRVLVLDHLKYRTKLRRQNQRISGGKANFVVFAGAGADPGETFQLTALRAAPVPSQLEWERFLRSLDGQPDVVVGDGETASRNAVTAVWGPPSAGGPEWVSSEWHWRKTLIHLLRRKHQLDTGTPLVDELQYAFDSPDEWRAYLTLAHGYGLKDLSLWLLRRQDEVLSQLETTQPRTWPRTTGGLEGILTQVDNSIAYRRAGFANAERTNRLLGLMVLERRHLARETDYSRRLRDHVMGLAGTAPQQRQIVGSAGGQLRR